MQTQQEMFDKSLAHMTAQAKPCVNRLGQPMYRHLGLSCTLGCLFNQYLPEFEGQPAGHLVTRYPILVQQFQAVPIRFVWDLAWLHDELLINASDYNKQLTEGFAKIANDYKLNYAP